MLSYHQHQDHIFFHILHGCRLPIKSKPKAAAMNLLVFVLVMLTLQNSMILVNCTQSLQIPDQQAQIGKLIPLLTYYLCTLVFMS